MRLAIVSDVHGNLLALEAVVADARALGVDTFVNLGDLLSGPLQPRETAVRLIELGWLTLRGNHERQLLETPASALGPSDAFARAQLTEPHRRWLGALPTHARLENDVLLVHGSPRSDLEYLLETIEPTGLRAATTSEVEARLGDEAHAALLACGHTHVPRVVTLSSGCVVVNPGSVGLPAYEDDRPFPHRVEVGTPHARYAIATRALARWSVELRQVSYDWSAASKLAAARGRPDWAIALATGRAR